MNTLYLYFEAQSLGIVVHNSMKTWEPFYVFHVFTSFVEKTKHLNIYNRFLPSINACTNH